MEAVVARGNVTAAVKRVRQNQGSPGVDGMTVEELPTYPAAHAEAIRVQQLKGSDQPKPVREAAIPVRRSLARTTAPVLLGWNTLGALRRLTDKNCSRPKSVMRSQPPICFYGTSNISCRWSMISRPIPFPLKQMN